LDGITILRGGDSLAWRRDGWGAAHLAARSVFNHIAGEIETFNMASSTKPRRVNWPSLITVISAAILIGAEVFGAAFAGGWALAILFGIEGTGEHVLQGVLFVAGVAIMVAFMRNAARIEPFWTR
jgi:hypothetical protein